MLPPARSGPRPPGSWERAQRKGPARQSSRCGGGADRRSRQVPHRKCRDAPTRGSPGPPPSVSCGGLPARRRARPGSGGAGEDPVQPGGGATPRARPPGRARERTDHGRRAGQGGVSPDGPERAVDHRATGAGRDPVHPRPRPGDPQPSAGVNTPRPAKQGSLEEMTRGGDLVCPPAGSPGPGCSQRGCRGRRQGAGAGSRPCRCGPVRTCVRRPCRRPAAPIQAVVVPPEGAAMEGLTHPPGATGAVAARSPAPGPRGAARPVAGGRAADRRQWPRGQPMRARAAPGAGATAPGNARRGPRVPAGRRRPPAMNGTRAPGAWRGWDEACPRSAADAAPGGSGRLRPEWRG